MIDPEKARLAREYLQIQGRAALEEPFRYTNLKPYKDAGLLSNIGQGISNAFNSIKQGMANQGARNIEAGVHYDPSGLIRGTPYGIDTGYWHQPYSDRISTIASSFPKTSREAFFNAPMAIPALGGALGTGAIMASGAGLLAGGTAVWAIREYLKTKQLQEQAKQAQAYAYAIENANREMNGLPPKRMPNNTGL